MITANHSGQDVVEEILYGSGMCWGALTDAERDVVIAMLAERLGVVVVRTNATKHGATEIALREAT